MLKIPPNKANTSVPSGFNARMNEYCMSAGSFDDKAKGMAKTARGDNRSDKNRDNRFESRNSYSMVLEVAMFEAVLANTTVTTHKIDTQAEHDSIDAHSNACMVSKPSRRS